MGAWVAAWVHGCSLRARGEPACVGLQSGCTGLQPWMHWVAALTSNLVLTMCTTAMALALRPCTLRPCTLRPSALWYMLWHLRVDIDTEHAVEEGLDAGQLVHVPRQVEPHAQKGVLHLPRRGAGWATCAPAGCATCGIAGGWAPRGVARLCHARLQGACLTDAQCSSHLPRSPVSSASSAASAPSTALSSTLVRTSLHWRVRIESTISASACRRACRRAGEGISTCATALLRTHGSLWGPYVVST